ncbi:hypothetical protein MHYP_G00070890 [Metynnis hypsauchen]
MLYCHIVTTVTSEIEIANTSRKSPPQKEKPLRPSFTCTWPVGGSCRLSSRMLKSTGSCLRSSRWQPVRWSGACWRSGNPRCTWGQECPSHHSSSIQSQFPEGLEPFFYPLLFLLQGRLEHATLPFPTPMRFGVPLLSPPNPTPRRFRASLLSPPIPTPRGLRVCFLPPPLTATEDVIEAPPDAEDVVEAPPAAEDVSGTLAMSAAETAFPDVPASQTHHQPLRDSLPTGRLGSPALQPGAGAFPSGARQLRPGSTECHFQCSLSVTSEAFYTVNTHHTAQDTARGGGELLLHPAVCSSCEPPEKRRNSKISLRKTLLLAELTDTKSEL